MAGTYEVDWDQQTNRLTFALHGTFDQTALSRFSAEFRVAVAKVPKSGGWTVLADLSDYPPQSDAINAGMEELMGLTQKSGVGKSVAMVPKAVVAMQVKRLASSAQTGIFMVGTLAEAEKYLAS